MIRNLDKLKKEKPNIRGNLYYKKYKNNAALISDIGIISCSKAILKDIRNKIIENRTIEDENFFSQFIMLIEINKGVYYLLINSVLDLFFSDEISAGKITREEIDDIAMSLKYSKKWLKDYIDKNFKELSDDEKLYIELGD